MSYQWPEFANEPLDAGRTWSARFESYDQRHDGAYYVVTLCDGRSSGVTFMAQVSAAFPDDEWIEDQVKETLRQRIAQVAATGQTNTSYRGPVIRM